MKPITDIKIFDLVKPRSWAMGVLYDHLETTTEKLGGFKKAIENPKFEKLNAAIEILSNLITDEATYENEVNQIRAESYTLSAVIQKQDETIKELKKQIETLKLAI